MHRSRSATVLVNAAQVIGALAVCGAVIYLLRSEVETKWVVIACFTLFYFGLVCYKLREFWDNGWYWAAFLAALLIHSGVVFLLQRNLPIMPGLFYGSIGAIEAGCIYALLLWLFFE